MQFEENLSRLEFYAMSSIDFTKGTWSPIPVVRDKTVEKETIKVKIANTIIEALRNEYFSVGVVDVRSSKEFREVHLRDSTNIALEHIKAMRCLLPPPGSRLVIIASTKRDLELANRELISFRYKIVFAAEWCRVIEQAKNLLVYESSFSRQLWKPSPLLAIALPEIESLFGRR